MVGALLTFVTSGLVVAKERVEVNRVVKQCVAIMRPQVIGPKKLIDHVNMRSARKFYVTGDATRLQQVRSTLAFGKPSARLAGWLASSFTLLFLISFSLNSQHS